MADTNKYEPHAITDAVFGVDSSQQSVSVAKTLGTDQKGTLCFTGDGNIVLDGAVYGVYLITGSTDVAVKGLNPDNVDLKSMWLTTDGHIWAVVKDATTGTKTINQFGASQASIDALQEAITANKTAIGTLSKLNTSNTHTNLVSAINEIISSNSELRTALLDKISNEESARKSADKTLQDSIDALSETVEDDAEVKAKALTDLDSRVGDLESLDTVEQTNLVLAINEIVSVLGTDEDAIGELDDRLSPVENKTSGIIYCDATNTESDSVPTGSTLANKVHLANNSGTGGILNCVRTYDSNGMNPSEVACVTGKIYNVNGDNYVFDGKTCVKIQGGGKTLTVTDGTTSTTFDGTTDIQIDTTDFTAGKVEHALTIGTAEAWNGSKDLTVTAADLGLDSAFKMIGLAYAENELDVKGYYNSEEEIPEDLLVDGNIFVLEDILPCIVSDGVLVELSESGWTPTFGTWSKYGIVTFNDKDGRTHVFNIYKIKDSKQSIQIDDTFSPETGSVVIDLHHREWYYNGDSWAEYGDEGSYALKDDTYTMKEVDAAVSGITVKTVAQGTDNVIFNNPDDDNLYSIEQASDKRAGVMSVEQYNALLAVIAEAAKHTEQLTWK